MSQELFEELIQYNGERQNLDFKESFRWGKRNDKRNTYKLIKHILAMANTQDGGSIIIGVKDGTFEKVGMKEEDIASFDQTPINTLLHKYTDPKHSCVLRKYKEKGKYFITSVLVLLTITCFKILSLTCFDIRLTSPKYSGSDLSYCKSFCLALVKKVSRFLTSGMSLSVGF